MARLAVFGHPCRGQKQADNAYGWLLRVAIQDGQPRAGLDATVDHLGSRFGEDPQMAKMPMRMRAAVALRKHTGIDAPASVP